MLSSPISRNLDELFQYGSATAMTSYGELRAVVEMTVYLSIMFIVTILWSEYGVAERARKMFDVIFLIESSDVGSPQCSSTRGAQQIESSKIVGFT
jgi:hypothetical protein